MALWHYGNDCNDGNDGNNGNDDYYYDCNGSDWRYELRSHRS